MSREKQDDWKRTQVRMPQDQYDDVVNYAEQNNLSLNSAMLELIDKGLTQQQQGVGMGLPPYSEYLKSIEKTVSITDDSIEKIAEKIVNRLKKAP